MVLIIVILVLLVWLYCCQVVEVVVKLDVQEGDGKFKGVLCWSGWIVLVCVVGYVVVVVVVIVILLGYFNFVLFVVQQLVWGVVVLLVVLFLLKFVDDLVIMMFLFNSWVGQIIVLIIGLSGVWVEQVGVLFLVVLCIGVILLVVFVLVVLFGNFNVFYGGLDVLLGGLKIGEIMFKFSSVVYVLLVFLVVWVVMQVFQCWFIEIYLLKIELDVGVCNFISIVICYFGIIVVVLWGLIVLGIGFEKLVLVVSVLLVGIGFGLQVIIQNFVLGLILLVEWLVKIGDWVKLGDQEGDIKCISVCLIEIQVGDKFILIVFNLELIIKIICNMMMGNVQGCIQIQFLVLLSIDVVVVWQILLDIYVVYVVVFVDLVLLVFIDLIVNGQIVINSFVYVFGLCVVYGVCSDLYFNMLQSFVVVGIVLFLLMDIYLVCDW